MNMRKSILLLTMLVLASLIVSVGFKTNFRSEIGYMNDYLDMMVYAVRGSWYPYSKKPYTEIPSEYPQVATYFFAAPYIILGFPGPLDTRLLGGLDTFLGSKVKQNPNLPLSPHLRNKLFLRYSLVFSLLMIPFLFFSILIVYELRPDRKHLAFLMMLPGGLYFTHNRFDIIPAFLSLLAIYLLSRERNKLSAFILALGFLTKWYVGLLLPVFMTYRYTRSKEIDRRMILVFIVTCLAILMPAVLSGGVRGLLAPYESQLSRGLEQPSLFFLVYKFFQREFGLNFYNFYSSAAFFLLQFSVIPLCVTSRIDSIGKVTGWSLLSILVFIVFARINSPQWILWVSPLLILLAGGRLFVSGIVLLDLLSYIQYPVLYTFHTFKDSYHNLFLLSFTVKLALLIGFTIYIFRRLIRDNVVFSRLRGRVTGPAGVIGRFD